MDIMNRAEFEADLLREGYEVREGGMEPDVHRGAHTHDFDARVMVLDGSITLVLAESLCNYEPGDTYAVPAGTMHEEHTEADGIRYVAGKRSPTQAVA
jgi:quercetin dioxygenase-like cupin family protein